MHCNGNMRAVIDLCRAKRGSAVACLAIAAALALPSIAAAEMLLDKVIVDFKQSTGQRADIEVTNTGKENMYVLVEPAEILNPGTDRQSRVVLKNPRKLGLLVTPNRLVLAPGQAKLVRLSLLSRPTGRDRIYRVKIRPVVGKLVASQTALKIIVGYDTLIIARPLKAESELSGKREGRKLTLHNSGNSNVLVMEARQCRTKTGQTEKGQTRSDCVSLPTRRIYAKQKWSIDLPLDGPAELKVRFASGVAVRTF